MYQLPIVIPVTGLHLGPPLLLSFNALVSSLHLVAPSLASALGSPAVKRLFYGMNDAALQALAVRAISRSISEAPRLLALESRSRCDGPGTGIKSR